MMVFEVLCDGGAAGGGGDEVGGVADGVVVMRVLVRWWQGRHTWVVVAVT